MPSVCWLQALLPMFRFFGSALSAARGVKITTE
jgi:hypothetical protein